MKNVFTVLAGIIVPSIIIFYMLSQGQSLHKVKSFSKSEKLAIPTGNYKSGQRIKQGLPGVNLFPDTYTSMFFYEPSVDLKDLAGDEAEVKNNPILISQLASIHQRTGVSADGVTKLIVVVKQDWDLVPPESINSGFITPLQNLTLSLPPETLKDGSLSKLGSQEDKSTSVSIDAIEIGGKRYVMAIYTAPDGYGEHKSLTQFGRSSSVLARAASSARLFKNFSIYTPPVVLIHGMWSSPNLWFEGGFHDFLSKSNFRYIIEPNYAQSSFTTFMTDNNPANYSSGVQSLFAYVPRAIGYYRGLNIAATQVDVVAHSLGGLMTRSFINTSAYKVQDNYLKGYVHKLITIGTPHLGSPLGTFLWCNKNVFIRRPPWFVGEKVPVSIIMAEQNKPIGSLHEALRPGSSALRNLGNSNGVKLHAITASYKPNKDNGGYGRLNDLIHIIQPAAPSLDDLFSDDHDLIVPVTSQKGGLSGKHITGPIMSTEHANIKGELTETETNSILIKFKVYSLLLSNDLSLFATSYPTPTFPSVEHCVGDNNFVPSPKNISALGTDDYVQITSPKSGTVFTYNTTDSIPLEFVPVGAISPVSAVFMIRGIGILSVPDHPPYRVKFKLPKNKPLNRVYITALVRDASGDLLAANAVIFIQPPGTVDNFAVNPDFLVFDSALNEQALSASAKFINGTDTSFADLTNIQSGITYKPRKGNAIIQVGENGEITALNPGTDIVDVAYKDKLAFVSVYVNSACSVKKPTITVAGDILISSSPTGNQWFLDGVPIDTNNTHTATQFGSYSLRVKQDCSSPMSDVVLFKNGLLVSAKVFLQGSFNGVMMTDSLRAKALIPVLEPYSMLGFGVMNTELNSETITTGKFDTTGTRAITDWIWLELRSAADPKQVSSTRSALLRRDGTIVDLDNSSPVRFYDVPEGNYYIALRHRNHLGVMTASALPLNSTNATAINFTSPATVTYGINAQKNTNGVMMMWAGDINRDGLIKYNGSMNDKVSILQKLGVNNPNGSITAYDVTDLNLDGRIRYNNASNDKTIILSNVGVGTPNNIITEQLPK